MLFWCKYDDQWKMMTSRKKFNAFVIKVFEWMNLFNSTLFSLFAEIWKEEPSREEQEGTAEQKETWEREKSFAQKVGKMKQKTELGKKEWKSYRPDLETLLFKALLNLETKCFWTLLNRLKLNKVLARTNPHTEIPPSTTRANVCCLFQSTTDETLNKCPFPSFLLF